MLQLLCLLTNEFKFAAFHPTSARESTPLLAPFLQSVYEENIRRNPESYRQSFYSPAESVDPESEQVSWVMIACKAFCLLISSVRRQRYKWLDIKFRVACWDGKLLYCHRQLFSFFCWKKINVTMVRAKLTLIDELNVRRNWTKILILMIKVWHKSCLRFQDWTVSCFSTVFWFGSFLRKQLEN